MNDVNDNREFYSLIKLDESEITLLWHVDWWDGPMSGMAMYREEQCWFEFHHEEEAADPNGSCHYQYTLFPLTPEQRDEAEVWHRSFGEWDAQQQIFRGRDEALHEEEWRHPDLSQAVPLGRFEDGSNASFYAMKPLKD